MTATKRQTQFVEMVETVDAARLGGTIFAFRTLDSARPVGVVFAPSAKTECPIPAHLVIGTHGDGSPMPAREWARVMWAVATEIEESAAKIGRPVLDESECLCQIKPFAEGDAKDLAHEFNHYNRTGERYVPINVGPYWAIRIVTEG